MPDDNDITMIPGPPTSWWSAPRSDFPMAATDEARGLFVAVEVYKPVDDPSSGSVSYLNVHGEVAGGLSGLKPEESAWLAHLHRHGS